MLNFQDIINKTRSFVLESFKGEVGRFKYCLDADCIHHSLSLAAGVSEGAGAVAERAWNRKEKA